MASILRMARYAPARPASDEDALTMMIAAGRACLGDGRLPDRLALASMELPYSRRVQAGLVAGALGLPATTFCLECTTSARAATETLRTLGEGLLLAAGGGFGAAALMGPSGGIARILAMQSAVSEYPGLAFTPAGESAVRDVAVPDYTELAYRDLIRTAADGLQGDLLALNPPEERLTRRAAQALGVASAVTAPPGSGAAGPLIALMTALERATPGQRVLLVSYGAGSAADAILLERGGN